MQTQELNITTAGLSLLSKLLVEKDNKNILINGCAVNNKTIDLTEVNVLKDGLEVLIMIDATLFNSISKIELLGANPLPVVTFVGNFTNIPVITDKRLKIRILVVDGTNKLKMASYITEVTDAL